MFDRFQSECEFLPEKSTIRFPKHNAECSIHQRFTRYCVPLQPECVVWVQYRSGPQTGVRSSVLIVPGKQIQIMKLQMPVLNPRG